MKDTTWQRGNSSGNAPEILPGKGVGPCMLRQQKREQPNRFNQP